MRHSCQKTWESTVENGQQAKRIQRSNFLLILRKQQTTRSHSIRWRLCHERPVRVGLHCQARYDYHPWRQCSLYGRNHHFANRGGSSHPCPLLDCLKRWQSEHTYHHPHRFNELAIKNIKNEEWNGKPRLKCTNGWHPPSKTPVDVLP